MEGQPMGAGEYNSLFQFARRPYVMIAAAAVAMAIFGAAPVKADVSLVFGAYNSDKPSAMVAQLRPTLDLLAKNATEELGEPVRIRLQITRGYDDGVDVIVNKAVDIMRLGAASYVLAKKQSPGIGILAMEQIRGEKEFKGIIAVHEKSTLRDIRELKGRTFAFGAKDSTIGRYLSQLELMQAGIFARDLLRYEYLGRHDAVGAAVGAGLFDAGALEETIFQKLLEEGTPIRALHSFPNVTKAWVSRAEMDVRIADGLRRALLRIKDPDVLRALRFDGFLPGTDSDYAITRQALEDNARFLDGMPDAVGQ